MENETELFDKINLDNFNEWGNIYNRTKVDSSVKFSAGMIFEYASSGSIYVTVEGGVINQSSIKVINNPNAKIIFKNNVLTVSNLPVGSHKLYVNTIPDKHHYATDSYLTITVKKAIASIKASKLTVALKKGSYWNINIVDSRSGKPLSNIKLNLKVYTGKKYKTVNIITNSKGIASYQTKGLSKGTHKVIVSSNHVGYKLNTFTSSIKVVKQKALKFKVKKKVGKDGSTLSITVSYKKKPINGVKLNLLVYTGKIYKTVVLKSKTKGKYKGVCGWGTNKISVGTHKIVIKPANIKYKGSKTVKLKIKKSAKKSPNWKTKI